MIYNKNNKNNKINKNIYKKMITQKKGFYYMHF